MMVSSWQHILAQDAKWNSLKDPFIRNLYLRRRSQLLAEVVGDSPSPAFDKNYLKLRAQILTSTYGNPEQRRSSRSDSFQAQDSSFAESSDGGRSWIASSNHDALTPSKDAHASRALAGVMTESLSLSYTFSGVHHIFEQSSCVNRLSFANNNPDLLGVADSQGVLCIYQVDPPKVLHRIPAHGGPIVDLEWSISNDVIICCSIDCSLSVWDSSKGSLLRSIKDTVPIMCAAFQPANNNMLAMGNARGLIQVVSVSTGMVVGGGCQQLQGNARAQALTFSICGTLLWVGDDKGSIHSYIFDIGSGKLQKGRRFCAPEGKPVTCISFRHWVNRQARDPCLLINSGNLLLVYGVVNAKDGTLVLKKRIHVCSETQAPTPLKSCFSPIMSFRDGSCVVTGSNDGGLIFFDVTPSHASSPVNTLHGHSSAVTDVGFAADEKMLASSDSTGVVILWKKEVRQR